MREMRERGRLNLEGGVNESDESERGRLNQEGE